MKWPPQYFWCKCGRCATSIINSKIELWAKQLWKAIIQSGDTDYGNLLENSPVLMPIFGKNRISLVHQTAAKWKKKKKAFNNDTPRPLQTSWYTWRVTKSVTAWSWSKFSSFQDQSFWIKVHQQRTQLVPNPKLCSQLRKIRHTIYNLISLNLSQLLVCSDAYHWSEAVSKTNKQTTNKKRKHESWISFFAR